MLHRPYIDVHYFAYAHARICCTHAHHENVSAQRTLKMASRLHRLRRDDGTVQRDERIMSCTDCAEESDGEVSYLAVGAVVCTSGPERKAGGCALFYPCIGSRPAIKENSSAMCAVRPV